MKSTLAAKISVIGLALIVGSVLESRIVAAETRCGLELEKLTRQLDQEAPPAAGRLEQPPHVSAEETAQAHWALRQASAHLEQPDVLARAGKEFAGGKVGVIGPNNHPKPALAASKGVVLESIPAAPGTEFQPAIQTVEILNGDGSLYGTVNQHKGSPSRVVPVDLPAPYKLRLVCTDGSSIEWAGGTEPPPGYRFEIRPTGVMVRSGFAGGHTRPAWDDVLRHYGDLIHVENTTTQSFRIPGQQQEISVTRIKYRYGPEGNTVALKKPKTIFDGAHSVENLRAFEYYISPWVAQALHRASPAETELKFSVPIIESNGQQGNVTIVVTRRAGQIATWYIDS